MHITFTHIFGPVLVIVAFLMFGKGIVNRTRGRNFRPAVAFLLMLLALAYRFLQSKATLVDAYWFVEAQDGFAEMFFDRLTIALMDFGIGMCIDAGYLAYKKHNAKLFWVPGVLAMIISSLIYFAIAFIERVADGIRNPEAQQTELLLELGPDDQISEVADILVRYDATYDLAFSDIDATIDASLDDETQSPANRSEDDRNLGNYYVIHVGTDIAPHLMAELRLDHENVDQVAENGAVSLLDPVESNASSAPLGQYLANDPYAAEQWAVEVLDYNGVHALLRDAKPAKKALVVIVDTGVEGDHEDISEVFKKSKGDTDGHGHGTHCAGLAGAVTNNSKGVASFNWEGRFLEIAGFHALNKNGFGTDRTVAQAIVDAANAGADVISMSLGGPGRPSRAQSDAIKYAFKKGAIVVVAAGNSNRDAKSFTPASMPGVITVSAVDPSLKKAVFSNTNTSLKMPIAAPGVDIMSSIPGSGYQKFSGTSMATPIVSGLVGIIRAFQPEATTKEAYDLLHNTGKSVADSDKVGRVIQPKAVVEALVPVPATAAN